MMTLVFLESASWKKERIRYDRQKNSSGIHLIFIILITGILSFCQTSIKSDEHQSSLNLMPWRPRYPGVRSHFEWMRDSVLCGRVIRSQRCWRSFSIKLSARGPASLLPCWLPRGPAYAFPEWYFERFVRKNNFCKIHRQHDFLCDIGES